MSKFLSTSDEDLFNSIKDGDEEAFTELYGRYKKALLIYASKKVTIEEAEDLLHDLFSKLWVNRSTLELKDNFSAYIFTALRNRILDYISHSQHINKYLDSLNDFSLHYYSNLSDYDLREKMFLENIEQLLVRFSPKVNQIVNLRMKGYSNQEIATILGLSEKTIRNQYSEAIKHLKSKLTTLLFIYFYQ